MTTTTSTIIIITTATKTKKKNNIKGTLKALLIGPTVNSSVEFSPILGPLYGNGTSPAELQDHEPQKLTIA